MREEVSFRSKFVVKCWKNRAAHIRSVMGLPPEEGDLVWLVERYNLIPDAGLATFLGGTLVAALGSYNWYMGLVDNAGFSTYDSSDTAAQIGGSNGWTEWQSYSEPTRQQFTPGTVTFGGGSAQVDNTASQPNFTMTAAGTIRGVFVASDSTKGGTSGTLLSEVDFTAGSSTVVIGNVLQILQTYSAYSG